MRRHITTFLAGATMLAAVTTAAPAVADPGVQDPSNFAYLATINCGRGEIQVGSGRRTFAPLVNMQTGRRYWPVAWNVHAGGHTIRARKRHRHAGRWLHCGYNDGQAKGTVTIRRPKDGRPRPQQAPAA